MSKPSARPGPRSWMPGYHRRHIGGGNVLKAVTRARRGHAAGRAPGKMPGPPIWRTARRRAMQSLMEVAEQVQTTDLVTEQRPLGESASNVEAIPRGAAA